MARVAQGKPYRWSARVRDGMGVLADADPLALVVTAPDGSTAFEIAVTDMSHDGTGLYSYEWQTAVDQAVGTYTGDWLGLTSDTSEEAFGYESVDVVLEATIEELPGHSYLTAERFRTLGPSLGLKLAHFTDFDLAQILEDAGSTADAMCDVSLLPTPHSFLGGRAEREEHRWRFPQTNFDRGTRRVYPKHWPVVSVEELRLVVGANVSTPLPVTSLVVNNAQRWVELTALTISSNSGLWGVMGWTIPIGGLMVPIAQLTYTYGWSLPVDGDRLYPVAKDSKVYQGAFGHWVPGSAQVTVDNVATPVDQYTIDLPSGQVTFDDDHTPTGVVRASYYHRLPRDLERGVASIARDLVYESDLARRGMGGLQTLRVNEIEASRARKTDSADLAAKHPEAALLLAGYKEWVFA